MSNITEAKHNYEKAHYFKAIRIYQTILKENPNEVLAYQGLAQCYLQINRIGEAYNASMTAKEMDRKLPFPHITLGSIYLKKNKLDDAEQSIRKALTLDSNLADAYIVLGAIYTLQGKVQDGFLAMQKAIELAPKSWKAHYNLAISLHNQQFQKEALKEFWVAFKLFPSGKTGYTAMNESMWIYRKINAIAMGIFLVVALLIKNSLLALPLVIIPAGYLLIMGYIYLRRREYMNVLINIVIIILLIVAYSFVWLPFFK